MTESCSICLNDMKEKCHTLECGHVFHTACLMHWFRSGGKACPLCRSNDNKHNLSYMDVRERCSYLRRKARNKTAPIELKRLYSMLLEAEAKFKRVRKERREFMTEHAGLRKKLRKLNDDIWKAERLVSRRKRTLGLFTSSEYTIPVVVPCKKGYH